MQQGLGLNSIFLVVMLGLFYVMVFMPEKKRKKKYNEMLNSISVNDEIITLTRFSIKEVRESAYGQPD